MAIMAGMGSRNPYGTSSDIVNAPYNRAMQDWQTRLKPLEYGATEEDKRNQIARQAQRDILESQDKKNTLEARTKEFNDKLAEITKRHDDLKEQNDKKMDELIRNNDMRDKVNRDRLDQLISNQAAERELGNQRIGVLKDTLDFRDRQWQDRLGVLQQNADTNRSKAEAYKAEAIRRGMPVTTTQTTTLPGTGNSGIFGIGATPDKSKVVTTTKGASQSSNQQQTIQMKHPKTGEVGPVAAKDVDAALKAGYTKVGN
jgi:hypothetical protein